jgi:hypothetical protein
MVYMNHLYMTFALALMASMLYLLYQHEARKDRAARKDIFNDCHCLLEQFSETPGALGFPVLKGNYLGYQAMLATQVDTLTMRKVPPLWLTVTVVGRQTIGASLALLVRPLNTGLHSPVWDWDNSFPIPSGWPQHAIAKYQGAPPSLEVLDDFVPKLFRDDKVKQLLITPELVTITYLAKQADRGEYLLMRNAVFDGAPLQREAVATLLQAAISLRQQLEGAKPSEYRASRHT